MAVVANARIVTLDQEGELMNLLKDAIKESKDPLLQNVADNGEFLRPFLIGRKLNVKHAFETVKGYMYAKHVKHAKIFRMKPRSIAHVLNSGFIGLLKNRHEGRVIGFIRCPKLDLKTMECDDIARAVILLSESLWDHVEDMRHGQIGLLDYSGYSWSVMTRYSLAEKITFMNVFWHNYPMMIKGVHCVHHPRIVTYAYSILRPFIPKKIKERLIMHGDNLQSLHEHVPPSILPVWLGGILEDEEAVDMQLIKKILKNSD